MEKQLTAVEFLEDKLMNHPYGGVYFPHNTKELFKQAKEMEKHQIVDAFSEGTRMIDVNDEMSAMLNGFIYYGETYEKQ